MSDETWPEGPPVDWRAAFLSRGLKLDDALYERDQARAALRGEQGVVELLREANRSLAAERDEARARLVTVTALLNQLIQP